MMETKAVGKIVMTVKGQGHPTATFDPKTRRLALIVAGLTVFSCQARNDPVRPGQYGYRGECPPGVYRLESPVHLKPRQRGFGEWFVRLATVDGKRFPNGRVGIGIHGGGSALRRPFAARQGWARTLGCIRVQNEDMAHLARYLTAIKKGGGRVRLEVGPARWDRR